MAYALDGSGTSGDPYKIGSASDWLAFVNIVNSYSSNAYAIMTSDVTVDITNNDDHPENKMVGYRRKASNSIYYDWKYYYGTFDGRGHTLTFNYDNNRTYTVESMSGSTTVTTTYHDGQYIAPFKGVSGCTIKNLKVAGTIKTSKQFASGIVAFVFSNGVSIENCISSVTIESTVDGDGTHAGFVSNTEGKVSIKNSLFSGELKGSSTNNCGGFVGWNNNKTITFTSCLFAPATQPTISNSGSATFARYNSNNSPPYPPNLNSCYYTISFGSGNLIQGTDASNMSATELASALGNQWVAHAGTVYLKPFQRYVDITGWASGSGVTPNTPILTGNYGNKDGSGADVPVSYYYLDYNSETHVDGQAPTSKGHYRVRAVTSHCYDANRDEWESWTSEMKFCVYDVPTKVTRDYNPTDNSLLTAGAIDVGTFWYKYNGTWSTTVPTATAPGDYEISYYIAGDETHNDIGSQSEPAGTFTSTINVKTETAPTIELSETSVVYNAKEQKPSVTVKDSNGNIIPESEYSVSYSENIEVGTATVTITDKTGGNYTIATTSVNFTITKEQLTVTVTANDLYYTTKEQELVTGSLSGSGSLSNCTLYYSIDNINYTTSVPKAAKIKTYTVYYKSEGDANHQGTGVATVEASIKVNTVTNPTITVTPSTFTYDGTEKEPDVTVKDGETLIHSTEYTVSYENNVNVGTAKVIITDNEGGNYIVSGTATFTIVENGSSYVPPKAKEGLVYTGKAQELIIGGSSTTGTMHYYSLDDVNYSTAIPKGTDAKTYTVYYKVVGDDNHYDSPATELTVVLSPKDVLSPTITLSPSTYTYDGTAKKPTVTVKDDDTEIPSSEYTVAYYNNTNIGKGRVKVTDNDGGNYCVNGSAIFYIVGEGSSFTEPTAKTDLTYNGKPQELIMPGSASSGTMKYSTDGKKYSTSIPKGTDAKTYNVYYKVVDSENNDQTPAYSLTVTISQKSVTISVTLTDAGANKMPSITVKDGDGSELTSDDYTYVVKDSDGKEVDTSGKISAGDYVITVTPTGNYTGSSVTASFSVKNSRKFIFTMQSDIIGVCLPYNRDVPNNYQAYSFDRVDDGNPVFKRNASETMTGGEPILLRYVGDQARTRATRTVDLSPSSPGLIDMTVAIQSQVNDGLVFTGTFNDINNTKGLMEGVYILQADDTWTHLDSSKSSQGSEICLEAFLTYFCYADHSMTTASLTTVLDTSRGDSPSAIHAVILEDEDGQQTWYDLNGHQIEAPQKGVNILRTADGKTKKVVKK